MSDYSPPPPPENPEGQGWGQQPPPPPYGAGPGGPVPFSPTNAIGYGWNKFKANPWPFVGITLLTIVVGGVLNGIGNASTSGEPREVGIGLAVVGGIVGLIFSIAAQIAYTLLAAATIRGALDTTEGKPVTFSTMFEGWDKLQVVIAALVTSVMTFIGIILCVLPGLVVIFMTFFTTFFIVGRGMAAIDAIKASFRFTADHIGPLVLLALLSVLCVFAGALACLVGLLVALPVVTISAAYSFRTLQGEQVAP